MADATYLKCAGGIEQVAAAAVTCGTIARLADGRAAVSQGLKAAESGDTVLWATEGIFAVTCATGTTFSLGDLVFWDESASAAIAPALTLDGSADLYLGRAARAKVSGQIVVLVDLNAICPLRPIVYEFDCQTGIDAVAHVLIPAEMNPKGLVITHVFALVTEAFAGGTQDQGIVTVSDESNNAICTLTASDASADAIGDYILGVQAQSTATGAATILQVAAGEYVDAIITQVTSGTAVAGKMKVYIEAIPLV